MARQTDQKMDHRTSQIAETVIGHRKTENAAPAPTPWTFGEGRFGMFAVESGGDTIAETYSYNSRGRAISAAANAELIVKAVNNHEALVKALTDVLQANDEFRASLPDDWEGDLLQDACIDAREALSRITAAR